MWSYYSFVGLYVLDTAGNESVSAYDIVSYLIQHDYDIYYDHWNEQSLYFGNHGNTKQEIDEIFGSDKFKLGLDENILYKASKQILSSNLDLQTFNQKNFLKVATDIIAIEKSLSMKMKIYWGLVTAST